MPRTTRYLPHGDSGPIDVGAILRVADGPSSSAMYHHVLNTVGHDHSGTLFGEAESAVAPLVQIAVGDAGWPANTALEVLIDMLGNFGAVAVATPGHPVPAPGMRRRMRAIAVSSLDELRRVALRADDFGTSGRAAELIEVLAATND